MKYLLSKSLMGLALSVLFAATVQAQPKIAASIRPVHALVSAVMGETGSPALILGGNTSPHNMALKPSQQRTIEGAGIIFHIGGGLEGQLEKPLKRRKASGAEIVTLIEAPDLTLLPIRESSIWPHGEHSGDDDHGIHDPHIWLDPLNARAMTLHIADVLAKADPANAATYLSNARRFGDELDKLQTRIAARLAPVRARPFIIFHDGYQYFEKRFALNAAGAIAADPDKRPGARRLRDIRQVIAERNALCVFAEPQFDISYVTTVIEGTAARTAQLDPIGTTLKSGTNAYITMMTTMADNIAGCLAADP